MTATTLTTDPTSTLAARIGWEKIALLVLLLLALIGPAFVYPLFLVRILTFVLFASAYNLIFGYAGLLGFGHAAFFGLASYTVAQSAKTLPITPEISLSRGVMVSAAIGSVFGWLAIKRQGLYFAMITLSLAQIVFFFFAQVGWAHGEDGIQSVPRGYFLGLLSLSDNTVMYYFVLCVSVLGVWFLWRVVESPYGEILKAVRDNEPRAISLGYNANRIKLTAFTISAGVAGLAGGLNALSFQLASLSDVHYLLSAEVILMVLIGGAATTLGPVLGAIVLVTMQNYLASLGAWVLIVQGVIFVLCVLGMRNGIVGTIENWTLRQPTRSEG